MRIKLGVILTSLMMSSPAVASEACRSAKDFVKVADSFYGENPELTNIITPKFTLAFKGINGAADPTALLYRYGDKEEVLPIEDGKLIGVEKVAGWSKEGEMCRMVDGELAPETEGDSVEANMSFSFPYKRTDGVFSVEEIKEGAKDGSKVMSKLAPGGLGFVVPGLKGIALWSAEGSEAPPEFEFSRNGKVVFVENTQFKNQKMFRLKDIKSSKADTLTIEGAYFLNAIFKFDPEDIAKAEARRLAELAESEN